MESGQIAPSESARLRVQVLGSSPVISCWSGDVSGAVCGDASGDVDDVWSMGIGG